MAAFNFQGWLDKNSNILHELYVAYAVSRILTPHLSTSSYPIGKLISDASGDVDKMKVRARIKALRDEMLNICEAKEINLWMDFVANRVACNGSEERLALVSGKDVLLPLVRLKMHNIERLGISDAILKIRLASHCNPVELRKVFEVADA